MFFHVSLYSFVDFIRLKLGPNNKSETHGSLYMGTKDIHFFELSPQVLSKMSLFEVCL